jgi:hypothetical protein
VTRWVNWTDKRAHFLGGGEPRRTRLRSQGRRAVQAVLDAARRPSRRVMTKPKSIWEGQILWLEPRSVQPRRPHRSLRAAYWSHPGDATPPERATPSNQKCGQGRTTVRRPWPFGRRFYPALYADASLDRRVVERVIKVLASVPAMSNHGFFTEKSTIPGNAAGGLSQGSGRRGDCDCNGLSPVRRRERSARKMPQRRLRAIKLPRRLRHQSLWRFRRLKQGVSRGLWQKLVRHPVTDVEASRFARHRVKNRMRRTRNVRIRFGAWAVAAGWTLAREFSVGAFAGRLCKRILLLRTRS